MSDLIDREALLRQIDIDSEGEPGYYGDTWKFIDTINSMPSAQLGMNLAEVGTDCISRQQAIDAFNTNIDELVVSEKENAEAVERYLNRVIDEIKQLSPIQPVIVPCDYAKACNEATMDKLTSAVAYYDALEELRKHGYVLVDMREVNHEND